MLMLAVPTALWAQSGPTPAGGSVKGTEGSLSFSVGSMFVQHTSEQATAGSAPGSSLYEGVQQTYRIDELVIDDIDALTVELTVYPNPTIGTLVIQSATLLPDMRYELYNMQGQLLLSGEMSATLQQLDLQEYASGVYMLLVKDPRNHREKHYKITKK